MFNMFVICISGCRCWLGIKNGVIWSFVGPILAVICVCYFVILIKIYFLIIGQHCHSCDCTCPNSKINACQETEKHNN